MELLLLSLKTERVWQRDYPNHVGAAADIADNIVAVYNSVRLHSELSNLPPNAFKQQSAIKRPLAVPAKFDQHSRRAVIIAVKPGAGVSSPAGSTLSRRRHSYTSRRPRTTHNRGHGLRPCAPLMAKLVAEARMRDRLVSQDIKPPEPEAPSKLGRPAFHFRCRPSKQPQPRPLRI